MKRLSLLTLVFACLMLAFINLLIFFRTPFAFYRLISNQDALDLLTPLVLIPVYWLMFKAAADREANLAEEVGFMLCAALWISGQGMHLAANSIDNLIEGLAKQQVIDVTATSIYQLAYFLDEHLSHYLWHAGIIGLAGLLILREWRSPGQRETIWWMAGLAALIHGFTLFCVFLEGQTMALGLPFTALVTLFGLIWGRNRLARQPLLAFMFFSCLLAFILFVGWGIYWGGFPQFSDVGLI
jgi:hypothetical protein